MPSDGDSLQVLGSPLYLRRLFGLLQVLTPSYYHPNLYIWTFPNSSYSYVFLDRLSLF